MAKIVDKFDEYNLKLIYPTDEEKKNKISCAVKRSRAMVRYILGTEMNTKER